MINSGTPTEVTISGNQTVLINGNVTLQPTTVVVIETSAGNTAPIVVDGSLTLNGTLSIQLQQAAVDGSVIPIIRVGASGVVQGTFSRVNVSAANRGCERVSGSFDRSTLGVTVSVGSGGCKGKGLSKGAIAGIVVGAVIVVAAVVSGLVIWGVREQRSRAEGSVYQEMS